jgi:hypothetical protein
MAGLKTLDNETKVPEEKDIEHGRHGVLDGDDASSLGKGDILSREHTDPVLNAKMHLINNVSKFKSFEKRFLLKHTQSYTARSLGLTSNVGYR